MQQKLYTDELLMFRDAVRRFFEVEIAPYHAQWEKDGIVPRELWQKAGQNGFLCMDVPEEYGGGGVDDYRFNAILAEEGARFLATGPGFAVHNELVAPYFMKYANEEQKKRTGKDKVKSAKNNDRKKPDKNSTPSNGENSSDEDKSKG